MRFAVNIFALLLVACPAWLASPALAQSACLEPAPPPPVDGAVTTADQLRAANADARAFISEASVYQACLNVEVEAARTRAAADGIDEQTGKELLLRLRERQLRRELKNADLGRTRELQEALSRVLAALG